MILWAVDRQATTRVVTCLKYSSAEWEYVGETGWEPEEAYVLSVQETKVLSHLLEDMRAGCLVGIPRRLGNCKSLRTFFWECFRRSDCEGMAFCLNKIMDGFVRSI